MPTTSIIAPNWATSNFSVSFNDSDNENINQSFFLVSDFDGTQWRANGNSGFFNDNFNDSIHSDWTNLSGTWNIVNSSLNQSDESLTNNNLYAIVQQDSANAYLYHWKMKISGSGTNRRAGIYFFCDNPEMEQRNNSYMVYFRVDQNTCQIYKSTDDNIVLQTSDPCNVELDTWYDCKIIFDPQTGKISVFQDNVLASEWTDPSPHSSGMAISLRTGNCNAFYDDIKVYKVRTANEFITVGQDMDCRYQNMNPLAPSCMVHSIVTDQAANFSELTMQTINIDWTPPTNILWVNDGLENDIDSTGSSSELSANWVTSQDENSGILKYIYAVGTSTAQDNIVPWTEIGNDTTVTVGSLNLVSTMYYFSVKAVNNAGLASEITTSDGILADVMVYDEKMNYYPSIIVSPNPFSSDICVEYNGAFKGNIKIVIYSYTGEIIYQSYFNGNKMTISLAHVAKGVYFLKITDNENNFLKKIIKE
ncbi:MAG: T9SS type A sorting domain-containing protein [Bacteroidia bacterium]|nr:T9SS type A sorting domain-containing protein [Bacteroidia bacterium]